MDTCACLDDRALFMVTSHASAPFPDTDAFGQKIQEAKLNYLVQSKVALTELAKNFVRLPL